MPLSQSASPPLPPQSYYSEFLVTYRTNTPTRLLWEVEGLIVGSQLLARRSGSEEFREVNFTRSILTKNGFYFNALRQNPSPGKLPPTHSAHPQKWRPYFSCLRCHHRATQIRAAIRTWTCDTMGPRQWRLHPDTNEAKARGALQPAPKFRVSAAWGRLYLSSPWHPFRGDPVGDFQPNSINQSVVPNPNTRDASQINSSFPHM